MDCFESQFALKRYLNVWAGYCKRRLSDILLTTTVMFESTIVILLQTRGGGHAKSVDELKLLLIRLKLLD